MSRDRIAILGVGNVGSALGERLARTGFDVLFGARPGKDLEALLERCQGRAVATSPGAALREAEVVFLAVPANQAVTALQGLDVENKIIVDCNNPVSIDGGVIWTPPPEGSTTSQLAAAYPTGRFVKGFSTFGAEFHLNPDLAGEPIDVPLASDDEKAKEQIASIAREAGFRPVDAGPGRNAALLENLAVLWIHLALFGGQGREFGFRLVSRREA